MAGKLEHPYDYEGNLVVYYRPWTGGRTDPVIVKAVKYTIEAAERLGIETQTDTMLAMWHRESWYDPKADDRKLVGKKLRSLGIAQTRASYMKKLRKFWLKRGKKLGPFSEIRTQAYFGVAEFYLKLEATHGDVWEAVRSYNGGGNGGQGLVKSRKYAHSVMTDRAVIFGRPYKPGERQPTDE